MHRAPLVSLCAVAALSVGGLVPSAEAGPADLEPVSGLRQPEPPRAVTAQRTLESVQTVFADGDAAPEPGAGGDAGLDGGRDLTVLLRDLRAQLPALRGEDRQRALAYLARPTDGAGDPYDDGYDAAGQNDCGAGEPGAGSTFCVHWVEETDDAPPLTDEDPANGIPDQVDRTRATLTRVWARTVGVAGYKKPLLDAGAPDAGPNRGLDIYLSNIGGKGIYGYCAGEPVPGNGSDLAAYCVLDDDYASGQFPTNTPLENLQVTAAHEFFHAVQFAYDAFEDVWLLEGTATWMEDELYDAVDDNRSYLEYSPMTRPGNPLDTGRDLSVYGSWIWWRYLSEQHGADDDTGIPTIIRSVWEAADDSDADRPGTYSLKAVRRVLAAGGTRLSDDFAGFGVANRDPASSYEEGEAYAAAPLAASDQLSAARPSAPQEVQWLDHLSTATVRFTPGDGLARGGWRLRARVDAPAARHSPVAQLTRYRTDGTSATKPVELDRRGRGVATIGFDSDKVLRVELTLTNAGHRFECYQSTDLSCQGASKSNDKRFEYKVRLIR